MNRKQRMQNAENYRALMSQIPSGRNCRNCQQPMKHGEGHFVPPSLGADGFFYCRPALLQIVTS